MTSTCDESNAIKISENGEDSLFFESGGRRISPWQDIPLFVNPDSDVVNMIVEIPRQSKVKMEVFDQRSAISRDAMLSRSCLDI